MKNNLNKILTVLIISICFGVNCCSQGKASDIYVLIDKSIKVEFDFKKMDTIHKYSCTVERYLNEKEVGLFKVCNLIFIHNKDVESVKKVSLKSLTNFISLEEALKKKNTDKRLFFVEKYNDYYLSYLVTLSKDFHEIDKGGKYYEKFPK